MRIGMVAFIAALLLVAGYYWLRLLRWAEGHPRVQRIALGALVAVAVLLSTGCGTMAQVRLGGERVVTPRAETVLELVCAGDEAVAVGYLAGVEFRLSEGQREDWLSRARTEQRAGKCPCPGKACGK